MELVVKLHGKMGADKFPFQTKYKEENIGYSKLFELDSIGFKTKPDTLNFKEAWIICEHENKAVRFPLVSLPTESRKSFFDGSERIADDSNHIFITILNPKLTLVCYSYNCGSPLLFSNLPDIEQRILDFDPKFEVNLVTYLI
jgi:hypothetical protein